MGLKICLSKDMADLQVFPIWRGVMEYENKFGDQVPSEKKSLVTSSGIQTKGSV
jgi:hypothetical protein